MVKTDLGLLFELGVSPGGETVRERVATFDWVRY